MTKPIYCECCGRELNPATTVSLELNRTTNLYAKPGTVPEDESQGVFVFGAACARKMLKDNRR